MAIYRKLLEMQKGVRAMRKDGKGFNYDFLKGDTILSYVRPKMDELGLILMPEVVDMKIDPVTYEEWSSKAKAVVSKLEMLCSLTMRFTWVDVEDGEKLEQMWASTGQNGFDKSFGSALTYGERYYLLKLLHIQTDRDDVDAVGAERDAAMDAAAGKGRAGNVPHDAPQPPAAKKDFPDDTRAKAWQSSIERMANGEQGVIEKLQKFYNITNAQVYRLNEMVIDYKINNNLK